MADLISNITSLPECVNGHVNTTPLYIKVAAAVTCVLSMCGALLIIFSYICFKEMRTKAREILVHISIADFIVSCANFIGIAVDFNSLLAPLFSLKPDSITPYLQTVNGFCVAQAFFSMFGGLGSILWTTAMAVYFYLRVMSTKKEVAQYSVYASYVLCYGGSLFMTAWFTATKRLGHTPVGGSGWCSLIISEDGNTDHFTLFFGGTLWLYFTFILLPILCISLLIQLKLQVSLITSPFSNSLIVNILYEYRQH